MFYFLYWYLIHGSSGSTDDSSSSKPIYSAIFIDPILSFFTHQTICSNSSEWASNHFFPCLATSLPYPLYLYLSPERVPTVTATPDLSPTISKNATGSPFTFLIKRFTKRDCRDIYLQKD